jgi:hypothetical protein
MSTRLSSIVWVRTHEYEVTFDVEGITRRCTCSVAVQDGVRFVEAVPDFLSALGVPPRLVAAAVLAFDGVNDPSRDASGE